MKICWITKIFDVARVSIIVDSIVPALLVIFKIVIDMSSTAVELLVKKARTQAEV